MIRSNVAVQIVSMLLLLSACADPVAVANPAPDLSPKLTKFAVTESQTVVDATRSWAIYPAGTGRNLRQTFRPGRDQRLGYIELPAACAAGVTLVVDVRDAAGTLLTSSNTGGLTAVGAFRLLMFLREALNR